MRRRRHIRAPSAAAIAAASAAASAAAVGRGALRGAERRGGRLVGPLESDLYMFNWSDYFDRRQQGRVRAEFGVDESPTTLPSNEELLAKLQAGGKGQYDIAVPTAEFSETLADGGFLQKLDKSRLPNLAKRQPARS